MKVAMNKMKQSDLSTTDILAIERTRLANERTFLAWIRTAIGIMAFGFVVEKFSLFLKYLAHYLIQTPPAGAPSVQHAPWSPGYSSFLGMTLIGLGASMGVLAFVHYKRTERQIDDKGGTLADAFALGSQPAAELGGGNGAAGLYPAS